MIIVLILKLSFLFFYGITEVLKLCLIMRGWCSCSYWMSFGKTPAWRWPPSEGASVATAFPAPPSVVVLLCLHCTGMCGMFWASHQVTAFWFVSTERVKPVVTETKLVYSVNRGFPEAPRCSSAAAAGRRTCSGRTILFHCCTFRNAESFPLWIFDNLICLFLLRLKRSLWMDGPCHSSQDSDGLRSPYPAAQ